MHPFSDLSESQALESLEEERQQAKRMMDDANPQMARRGNGDVGKVSARAIECL